MKRLHAIFILMVVFMLASCQTRVVSLNKPFTKNSLALYQKYTFQLNDASIIKMEVLRIDNDNVYGKTKNETQVVIKQSDIREARKLDVVSSLAVGLGAIAAVILAPI